MRLTQSSQGVDFVSSKIDKQIMDGLADLDYDDLDKQIYECYSCGWNGDNPFEQATEKGFWEEQETTLLCPVCGTMI